MNLPWLPYDADRFTLTRSYWVQCGENFDTITQTVVKKQKPIVGGKRKHTKRKAKRNYR